MKKHSSSATPISTMQTVKPPHELFEDCWLKIMQGTQSRKSNYHSMCLSYIANQRPRSIMMIPRRVDLGRHIIYTHTDYRSTKIQHLQNNPHVAIVFWCRENKTQIAIEATCKILYNNANTQEAWTNMRNMSKMCYCADISPGTETESMSSSFSREQWQHREKIANTDFPYQNFSILALHATKVERLFLSAHGHNKIVFSKTGSSNDWTHQWKAP